ncbi:MAG TPA: hypothetical protein VGY97_06330 [Solirubrobacteraceae bacterium]|nr:hypothetical protein [Solirubrobacteraceae bacterium]
MNGYEVLGRVVWRVAKWYLRRTYGHLIPSRRVAAAILVVLGVVAVGLAGRHSSST